MATDITERIAKYKELLDSGALTQEEFEALKAKALTEELGGPVAEADEPEVTEDANVEPEPANEPEPVEEPENPKEEPAQQGIDRDNSVTVTFTIEGDRLFPEVEGADGSRYSDGFIKPKGQSVNSFCAEVAEMMERDMGRLVRYRFAGTRKRPARPVLTIDSKHAWIFIAACAAVVVVMLVWLTFANNVAYKGDVRGLISHCQTMGKHDRETVEVTGYVWRGENEPASEYVVLTPDGNYYGVYVLATLKKSESPAKGSRMTVRGTVSGVLIDSDHVYVNDAEVVN